MSSTLFSLSFLSIAIRYQYAIITELIRNDSVLLKGNCGYSGVLFYQRSLKREDRSQGKMDFGKGKVT